MKVSEIKRPLIPLVLLGLTIGAVFFPTLKSLVEAWWFSDDYSHGFLIIPISGYVLWQKREELMRAEDMGDYLRMRAKSKSSWLFFPAILLTLFLYVLAHYAGVLTLAPLAMILFLSVTVCFLYGLSVFRICLFALFLLLFMIPVPTQVYSSLTIPLQLYVTKATVIISQGIGVPILREGNVLFLPEHTLQVVEACSGLRSIMTLLTLGTIISYFFLKSFILRVVLSLSAIPIAIMINIVRVMLMVIAFYYFDFDLAQGALHTAFGATIFVLAVVFFLMFRKVLALCER